jgi:hypothetical protein
MEDDFNFKLLAAKMRLGELRGQKMFLDQAINFLQNTDENLTEKTILPNKNSGNSKTIKSEKEIVSAHSDTSHITTIYPLTLEERQRVHWGLCSYVFNNDGHRGLTGFLKKVTNNNDLQKILRWLDVYSTVEIENQVNGAYLFRKKKNIGTFSPKLGKEKPYYEMDVMSKADRFKVFTLAPPSGKSSTQKSDKEFKKKVIKGLLDYFLNNPTLENKKQLNNEIDSFINTPSQKRGSPFVSGGLPSLGKNR